MFNTILARAYPIAVVIATLSATFGATAQEAAARIDAAQNGGAAAAAGETAPKYHAGLNGRVKPAETKARAQGAQNGGDASNAAYVQPRYNNALSGRSGAAPRTMAQSDKDAKKAE